MRFLKSRWSRFIILLTVPTVLFLVMRAQASWRPQSIYQFKGTPHSIAFLPTGQGLAVLSGGLPSENFTLRYITMSGQTKGEWKLPSASAKAMLAENGNSIYLLREVSGKYRLLDRFDPATHKTVQQNLSRPSDNIDLISSPDGQHIACIRKDRDVKVLDIEIRNATMLALVAVMPNLNLQFKNPIDMPIAFVPHSNMIAVAKSDSQILLFDFQGRNFRSIHLPRFNAGSAYSLIFSPDGSKMITCPIYQNSFTVTDLRTGRHLWQIATSDLAPNCAVDPSSKWLAITDSSDILLLDLSNGKLLRRLRDASLGVIELAFSPDSNWLASCVFEGTESKTKLNITGAHITLWRLK